MSSANKTSMELYTSIRNKDIEKLKELISNGTDIQRTIPYINKTPLQVCLERGDTQTLNILCEGGVDIHKTMERGESALFVSAKYGHLFTSTNLIKMGVDINKSDHNGDTPLHILLKCNIGKNAEFILKRFLEAGADTNIANNDGITPLMICAKQGSYNNTRMLIEYEADPLMQDKENRCAYDYLKTELKQKSIGDILNPTKYGHLNSSMSYS